MSRVIVCDVNETLLDIGALGPVFSSAFGDSRVVHEWFTTVLLYSEVATLAGPYYEFATIGAAALDMTAAARGVRLTADNRTRILQGMLSLPPHPEVSDGLGMMRDAGLRIVTLTNSAPAAVERQLAHAGLTPFFERVFSVDTVRKFKPAADVYRSVADSLALSPDRLRMVAAHGWDVSGALQAGYAAAFVARPGKVLYPLGPQPDIIAPDFREAARQIIAAEVVRRR
jgi:2-haloacid dehalogenase